MHKLFSKVKKIVCCFLLTIPVGLFSTNLGLAETEQLANAELPAAKFGTSPILQRIQTNAGKLPDGRFYVPATVPSIRWGFLPNKDSQPVLTVPSKSVITFDTLSSEGMVEDQGRDPIKFFGKFGVHPSEVLKDAIEICASDITHSITKDGPHIIMGPVAIEGAQPGDVLKVDMIAFTPRVPYGIVGNRHGKGALPGEYPQNDGPWPGADKQHPELFGNVFTFVPIKNINGKTYGIVHTAAGKEVCFPLHHFMGIMGVAPDTAQRVNSIPPSSFGGNLDLKDLTEGTSLYLPIQVPGGMFFLGDSHFGQGDGEVALTAVEGSLRSTLRLTLLKAGDSAIPGKGAFTEPFAETADFWMPIGLDPDLNEAMKKAVRASLKFLTDKMGMDGATALSYLSGATDFEITQVVDETKGVHAHIRKKDFADKKDLANIGAQK